MPLTMINRVPFLLGAVDAGPDRTVAEGMAGLFVASGVPYAFWTFCLMAFLFVYARSPGAAGAESPYQFRFNRSYDLSTVRPFGSVCYYLSAEHEKFASRGRLGVVLGYAACSRLQSHYVLDFELYVETNGEARIVHTRDVHFPPQLRHIGPNVFFARIFSSIFCGPSASCELKEPTGC